MNHPKTITKDMLASISDLRDTIIELRDLMRLHEVCASAADVPVLVAALRSERAAREKAEQDARDAEAALRAFPRAAVGVDLANMRDRAEKAEAALARREQQSPRGAARLGPKGLHDQSLGAECPACHRSFSAGDYTALVPLGPGADPDERDKAYVGQPHNAVAVEVHWACATGDTNGGKIATCRWCGAATVSTDGVCVACDVAARAALAARRTEEPHA